MKNIILPVLVLILILTETLTSQPLPDRYHSMVFTNWTETTDITFSTGVPRPNPGGGFSEWITGDPLNVTEYQTTAVNLKMNIFTPTGDTLSKRPVIIIAFGGGFLSGSKDHWSIRLLAQNLAKRGFVTAVIDYRLGMNIFDDQLAMRAVYRGLQDGRSAVRFFKADAAGANIFRADPQNIYLGGHSSGGFIALHNAYLDTDSDRPVSTRVWNQNGIQIPDLLSLDSVGNNRNFDGRARAVFSLAGALGYTEYIEESTEPRVTLFHSTDDETVPYESGEPFSNLLWLVVGSDLPVVYGSNPISVQATSVGLAHDFHSYTNRGHGVHENGSNSLHGDIVPKISDGFYVNLLRPAPLVITGDTVICNDQLLQEYKTRQDSAAYYDWTVTGGSLIQHSPFSPEVVVLWNENAPVKSLSVTPYSYHRARGLTKSITVDILLRRTNTWTGGSGLWNTTSDWSLGISPDVCHNVVFPDLSDLSQNVTMDSTARVNISKIYIGQNQNLTLLSPLRLENASGIEVAGQLTISDTVDILSVYDADQNSLEVAGTADITTNGVLNISQATEHAVKVVNGGNLSNHGKMNIMADNPNNLFQDIKIEGAFTNYGTLSLSHPDKVVIHVTGGGVFTNEGIMVVKEE
ncbi:MAG: alpha/beta hydrolase [Saprospiraceae bacterium]|nr:alpha/beta hydrolase [Saprospiraceae bacterium]